MAACGRGTADVPAIFINALCVSRFWLIIKLFPLPAYKTCAMIIYKYLINCNGLSTFLTLALSLSLSLSCFCCCLCCSVHCDLQLCPCNGLQWQEMAIAANVSQNLPRCRCRSHSRSRSKDTFIFACYTSRLPFKQGLLHCRKIVLSISSIIDGQS